MFLFFVEGVITVDELESAIVALNEHPTKEEIQEMMNEADTDEDGSIHFQDFLSIMSTKVKVIQY